MTAATELRGEIGGRARDATVRQRLARRRAGQRAIASRRTEALVVAHVARRAGNAARAQRRVERGIGRQRVGQQRRLLGERRVAVLARERRRRLAHEHLGELAGDARAHRRRVRARSPVRELHRMAGAARLRRQRRFERREARRRQPLRGERHAPVTRDERLDGVHAHAHRGPRAARDEQRADDPRP